MRLKRVDLPTLGRPRITMRGRLVMVAARRWCLERGRPARSSTPSRAPFGLERERAGRPRSQAKSGSTRPGSPLAHPYVILEAAELCEKASGGGFTCQSQHRLSFVGVSSERGRQRAAAEKSNSKSKNEK